ncbi:MAG: hypothetical protein UU65_C0002G0285 [candidate division CPR2 bacterium GW2011_GWC1_41_48]|uniref:Uncharacterized protein n=1 Tax=candidate division CPR2 bacterium GW2011_GWC1_41_48 TaxID=1618344 RepID=A0A0G0WBQ5_UNCC2|nr:MAG: hypothetical protein UT47_C0002G0019 [candidate division CPR2 bacterium GW2011_GWC2_39_35]KKR26965.1 MAG: hypothetical protein UT59_C0074G0002 [candidate division CPR2 bacterium GW2011_GWD1_39_7]KKR29011.1 MAG: hypothetical protein UT60_C0008G0054 [candidate division CPR2 bacterium GW2011_GWD2_39_7]KKS09507.1 MAG: hypothetical protein UU65_C0002G0285 [candidate division CPR2 bacterium GW2011_GWC1_41_48]OGB56516.1 MAG: hypothetical protein A2Y27_01535 [candidate division CPR2 bacterium G
MEKEIEVPINTTNSNEIANDGFSPNDREKELANKIYKSETLDELRENLKMAIAEGFNNSAILAEKASLRNKELTENNTQKVDTPPEEPKTDKAIEDELIIVPTTTESEIPTANESADDSQNTITNDAIDNPTILEPSKEGNEDDNYNSTIKVMPHQDSLAEETSEKNPEITDGPIDLLSMNETEVVSEDDDLDTETPIPITPETDEKAEELKLDTTILPSAEETVVPASESLTLENNDLEMTANIRNYEPIAEETAANAGSDVDLDAQKLDFNKLMGELVYMAAETDNLTETDRDKSEDLGDMLKKMWAEICQSTPREDHKNDTEYIEHIIDDQIKKIKV